MGTYRCMLEDCLLTSKTSFKLLFESLSVSFEEVAGQVTVVSLEGGGVLDVALGRCDLLQETLLFLDSCRTPGFVEVALLVDSVNGLGEVLSVVALLQLGLMPLLLHLVIFFVHQPIQLPLLLLYQLLFCQPLGVVPSYLRFALFGELPNLLALFVMLLVVVFRKREPQPSCLLVLVLFSELPLFLLHQVKFSQLQLFVPADQFRFVLLTLMLLCVSQGNGIPDSNLLGVETIQRFQPVTETSSVSRACLSRLHKSVISQQLLL